MARRVCQLVVPDAGPLITLAYAGRLDLLLALGLEVVVVDMVRIALTRDRTRTSEAILAFLDDHGIRTVATDTGKQAAGGGSFRKRHTGERAIQEFLFDFYDEAVSQGEDRFALLLFGDHKIAGTGFVLPDKVYALSTRAFLLALQARGLIESADAVGQAAARAGREFSRRSLHIPPKSDPSVAPFEDDASPPGPSRHETRMRCGENSTGEDSE